MAVKGYLAGIFRSLGVEVGSEERHQLLLNSDFETGDTTSWTGTATVNPFGRYGFGHYATIAATNSSTQTVALDNALTAATDIVVRLWAKPAEAGCKLEVDFLDNDTGASINTETLTLSTSPTYEVNGWSLYSMRVSAPGHASTATLQTKEVKFTITAGAAEALDVDDCEMVFVQQIAGATGELSGSITVDTTDITTFKSAQDDNAWRRHLPTLRSGEQITVSSYFLTEDADIHNIVTDEPVFVQLYSNVSTNERWEFYAYATGLTGAFPLEGAREMNSTLTVTGDIGFTDTTED